MKKIIINERQERRLMQEFVQDGFSFEALDSFENYQFAEKLAYCRKFLGNEIGHGVGRVVFDFNDNTILKLQKDTSYLQNDNKIEWENTAHLTKMFDIFPKCLAHADDFSWIICERVLPMTKRDCEVILGIPWSDDDVNKPYNDDYDKYAIQKIVNGTTLEGFIAWADNIMFNRRHFSLAIMQFFRDFTDKHEREINRKYTYLMKNNPNKANGKWFSDLYKYIGMIGGFGDMHRGNFGVAMRNGKPTIVILDSGSEKIKK